MLTIRKHCFETNSSSTHAICFGENPDKIDKDCLGTICGEFTYYKSGCDTDYNTINVYTNLKDKLTWLITSMKQVGMDNPFVVQMKLLLEKVMPNATFDYGDPDEPYYEFEDIDCLWYSWEGSPDGYILLDEKELVKFLTEGIVVWGDRDYCSPITWDSYVDNKIEEYPECIVKFSG